MIVPNAKTIELAIEGFKGLPGHIRKSQVIELMKIVEPEAAAMGIRGFDTNFVLGYQLGLQTARTLLEKSIPLILAEIDPQSIL